MKKLLNLNLVALVSILILSCGSVGDASKQAEQFHELFKQKNFDQITQMISEEGLEATPAEDWKNLFKTVIEKKGDLKSYKKTGFHTQMNNGVTTVELNYTLNFADETLYEKLTFIKKGDDYKILGWKFNKDKSAL